MSKGYNFQVSKIKCWPSTLYRANTIFVDRRKLYRSLDWHPKKEREETTEYVGASQRPVLWTPLDVVQHWPLTAPYLLSILIGANMLDKNSSLLRCAASVRSTRLHLISETLFPVQRMTEGSRKDVLPPWLLN